MTNLDQTTPDETPKQDQKETMFEVLEKLEKDLDEPKHPEVPGIWINESYHCQSCGS